ncbi:VolA/Pla-1 family phospholipase [Photobacterium sp.]|uniref:VolA/Pla-1 family phospholipase n=1 Tax=Photobacterium sp. TaxID=660 RepID=UPI00299F25EE|nr:VolA/Pla-1 family phospholipase [Photobacterium sp.]MDX1303765.1 lipase [Photobacterium sp.]
MKKNILAVLIASSISLYGCGNESEVTGNPTIDPIIEKSLKAETKILFDLASKTLVLPTFLAMDSTDGTLKSDGVTGDEGYTDISNPAVAMGKTDGWGTTQPIVIEFMGNDLYPSMNSDGFYLIESNNPTATNQTKTPTLVPDDYFQVMTSGKKLTVILKKPLNPASNYMFAITDELKDINGNSVGMTGSYATLKATAKPPLDTLIPLQTITHTTEKELEIAGVNADSIIFSTWFTTASVGDVLFAAKSASALALKNGANTVWKGTAVSGKVSEADLNSLFSMSLNPSTTSTPDGNVIYTGSVKLPYFLETNPSTFSVTPWQSGMPSLAKISNILKNGSDADKAAIAQQLGALGITTEDLAAVSTDTETQVRVLSALTGEKLILTDGSQLDTERLITRYSPVPKLKSIQDVKFTLVLPQADGCQVLGANSVSIYQHGITSYKESLNLPISNFALSDSIIGNNCQAIFAIDHPLHGERGIDIPGEGYVSASGDDGKPEIYLNLSALPVARDNLRQSTIDVVNLRVAIGRIFATLASKNADAIGKLGVLARLNPANGVGFVGHSLGAMTGVSLGYIANKSVGDLQADAAFFNINKLGLANPGAAIPYLLLGSQEFGNFVKGSLVAGTDATFKENCKNNALDIKTCYAGFEAGLIAAGDEKSLATLTGLYSAFNQFAYAAQSVLDTVDPINHSMLIDRTLPVYLAQVNGDETIPNQLIPGAKVTGTEISQPYSPFAGTLPLVGAMELTPTATDINGQTIRNAVLFNAGDHLSLLNPTNNGDVTSEMQSQISSLLNNGGTTLDVNNSNGIISTTP